MDLLVLLRKPLLHWVGGSHDNKAMLSSGRERLRGDHPPAYDNVEEEDDDECYGHAPACFQRHLFAAMRCQQSTDIVSDKLLTVSPDVSTLVRTSATSTPLLQMASFSMAARRACIGCLALE